MTPGKSLISTNIRQDALIARTRLKDSAFLRELLRAV